MPSVPTSSTKIQRTLTKDWRDVIDSLKRETLNKTELPISVEDGMKAINIQWRRPMYTHHLRRDGDGDAGYSIAMIKVKTEVYALQIASQNKSIDGQILRYIASPDGKLMYAVECMDDYFDHVCKGPYADIHIMTQSLDEYAHSTKRARSGAGPESDPDPVPKSAKRARS
jgi:hypothetical protein